MLNQNGGSKTDVIVKLSLVFFIALLSFSIGTFVGKKFSDNQHKLAQLEPGSVEKEREVASVKEGALDAKPKDALSDDEIAKLAEEFVSDDTKAKTEVAAGDAHAGEGHATDAHAPADAHAAEAHGEVAPGHAPDTHATAAPGHATPAAHEAAHEVKHEEKTPAPHAAEPTHAAAAPTPSKVSERVAEGKTPTEEHATHKVETKSYEAPQVPSKLPSEIAQSTVGKYTVQVASYPTEAEAKKAAGSLKEKGFSAFYIPANIKGHSWYRVSVGLFTTQKEATTYKSEVMEKANVSSAIVQKITE